MVGQIENGGDLMVEQFLNQNKAVVLNANLLTFLVDNKVISLNSWQKKFAFYMKQSVECMNDMSIADFIELLVIK